MKHTYGWLMALLLVPCICFANPEVNKAEQAYRQGQLQLLNLNDSKALNYFQRALEREPQNARFLDFAAHAAGNLGEQDLKIHYQERALQIYMANSDSDPGSVSRTLNQLSLAWHEQGRMDKAIYYYELGVIAMRKRFGEAHPHTLAFEENLGRLKGAEVRLTQVVREP